MATAAKKVVLPEKQVHPDDDEKMKVTYDSATKEARWHKAAQEANVFMAQKLPTLDDGSVVASNEAVAQLTDGKGVVRKVKLPDGKYDLEKLKAALKKAGEKGLDDAAIGALIQKVALSEVKEPTEGIWFDGSPSNAPIAGGTGNRLAVVDEDGKLVTSRTFKQGFPFRPAVGTVIKSDGTAGYINSKEAYLRALPALCKTPGAWNEALYLQMIPCEAVAYLADKADEMWKALQKEMELLPEAELYSITPVLCRYFSDGDKKTQISARWGQRSDGTTLSGWTPVGNSRPMLYDGPAWRVGLKIAGTVVNGGIIIAEHGSFVATIWCQREVSKDGGIELINGEILPHTLMSWCAGAGMDKFGGELAKKLISKKDTSAFSLAFAKLRAMGKRCVEKDCEPLLFYWSSPDPEDKSKDLFYASPVYAVAGVPKKARISNRDIIKSAGHPIWWRSGGSLVMMARLRTKDQAKVVAFSYNESTKEPGLLVEYDFSSSVYNSAVPMFFVPEGTEAVVTQLLHEIAVAGMPNGKPLMKAETDSVLPSFFDPKLEEITVLDVAGMKSKSVVEGEFIIPATEEEEAEEAEEHN